MKRLSIILLPLAVLAAVLVFSAGHSDTARADPGPVLAGFDLLETSEDPNGTFQDFSFNPLPAGLFGPGCAAFADKVQLQGVPIGTFAGFPVGSTDTVIERKQDAQTTFPDFVGDTIDIEIVTLSLVSIAPMTITGCVGGDQLWEMKAEVPEVGGPPQSTGSLKISHEYPDGGTFVAELPVSPLITFTRIGGPGVFGPFPGPTFVLESVTNRNWCHTANPLDDPAGATVLEVVGLTTNFFPGIICPDSPHNGLGQIGERTKRPILDVDRAESEEFNHKVEPAENPKASVGGITELLVDGSGAPSQASGSDGDYVMPIAAALAAGALVLAAGGWYARRRWLA